MRPFACGIVCCCGNRVDAFTFYKREEDNLTQVSLCKPYVKQCNVDSRVYNQKFCIQALEAEKESTKTRSIGIAFLTFANLDDARKVNRRQLLMTLFLKIFYE